MKPTPPLALARQSKTKTPSMQAAFWFCFAGPGIAPGTRGSANPSVSEGHGLYHPPLFNRKVGAPIIVSGPSKYIGFYMLGLVADCRIPPFFKPSRPSLRIPLWQEGFSRVSSSFGSFSTPHYCGGSQIVYEPRDVLLVHPAT